MIYRVLYAIQRQKCLRSPARSRIYYWRFWVFAPNLVGYSTFSIDSSREREKPSLPSASSITIPLIHCSASKSMLKLWRWYQNCLVVHPVKTQVVSSGILWGLGDIGAQVVTQRTLRDKSHNRKVIWSSLFLFFCPCPFCIAISAWCYDYFRFSNLLTCGYCEFFFFLVFLIFIACSWVYNTGFVRILS